MPRPPTPKDVQEQILADWRTGEYSIRAIAYRHDVSSALVGKLVKGVPKDLVDVIDAGVKYRTTLLQENRHVEDAVSKIVDEKTRHIAFFANATIKNISYAGPRKAKMFFCSFHGEMPPVATFARQEEEIPF